eukprot:jgi/Psemu1/56167/gm1.56167_g
MIHYNYMVPLALPGPLIASIKGAASSSIYNCTHHPQPTIAQSSTEAEFINVTDAELCAMNAPMYSLTEFNHNVHMPHQNNPYTPLIQKTPHQYQYQHQHQHSHKTSTKSAPLAI